MRDDPEEKVPKWSVIEVTAYQCALCGKIFDFRSEAEFHEHEGQWKDIETFRESYYADYVTQWHLIDARDRHNNWPRERRYKEAPDITVEDVSREEVRRLLRKVNPESFVMSKIGARFHARELIEKLRHNCNVGLAYERSEPNSALAVIVFDWDKRKQELFLASSLSPIIRKYVTDKMEKMCKDLRYSGGSEF